MLRCNAKFTSCRPVLQEFVVLWQIVVETWASAPQTSFIGQEAQHFCSCSERFIQGSQMFPIQQPQGVVVGYKNVRVPKKDKWAHMLPSMLQVFKTKTLPRART